TRTHSTTEKTRQQKFCPTSFSGTWISSFRLSLKCDSKRTPDRSFRDLPSSEAVEEARHFEEIVLLSGRRMQKSWRPHTGSEYLLLAGCEKSLCFRDEFRCLYLARALHLHKDAIFARLRESVRKRNFSAAGVMVHVFHASFWIANFRQIYGRHRDRSCWMHVS